MFKATTVVGNNMIGTCTRIRNNPIRNNRGSTNCSINISESRVKSNQDPSRDIHDTQPQSTSEDGRNKSHGPSPVTYSHGIIIWFSHKDHARNISLGRHHK
jgi:hypothetical protein